MSQFFKTKKEIENWLKQHKINFFKINVDLTVDVETSVDLSSSGIEFLPVQFGRVDGNFDISNNQLNSLKGCPSVVGGEFNCSSNIVSSLDFCPKIADSFCLQDNQITSLAGGPESVVGCFYVRNNNLTTLEGGPTSVYYIYDCSQNELTTLKGAPEFDHEIFEFNCGHNKLTSLKHVPKKITKLTFWENPIKSLEYFPSEYKRVYCDDDELRKIYPDLPKKLTPEYTEKLKEKIQIEKEKSSISENAFNEFVVKESKQTRKGI